MRSLGIAIWTSENTPMAVFRCNWSNFLCMLFLELWISHSRILFLELIVEHTIIIHTLLVIMIFELTVNTVKWLAPKAKTLTLSRVIQQKQRLTRCHFECSKYLNDIQIWVKLLLWSVKNIKGIVHLVLLLLSIIFDLLHHVSVPVIVIKHVIVVSHVIFERRITTFI